MIATLSKAVNAVLADPVLVGMLADLGVDPFPSTPPDFGKFTADYTGQWGKIIRAAGVKAE